MSMVEWASPRGTPAGASPRYLMLRVGGRQVGTLLIGTVLAHRAAVGGLQPTERGGRGDRADSEHQEGLVDTVNHLRGIGVKAIRQEQRGDQRSRCDAE